MKRQDIRLLAYARQGDVVARLEVARRYLLGTGGFARHVALGLEYLGHASVADRADAACVVAACLPLHEILAHRQEAALTCAAASGLAAAQVKLALWQAIRQGRLHDDDGLFSAAAAQGEAVARWACGLLSEPATDVPTQQAHLQCFLRSLSMSQTSGAERDVDALTLQAARLAASGDDADRLARCLANAISVAAKPARMSAELAELLMMAVQRGHRAGHRAGQGSGHDGAAGLAGIDPALIRAAFEQRASQGDADAAYLLGRALCAFAVPGLPASVFAADTNMRKGAAFLLRAADAGREGAWLDLYHLHSDHSLSVANAQLARFFLEKAAAAGQVEAQLKLGATILRESSSLADSEQAIHWLHLAAAQGEPMARDLLESLVLKVRGDDEPARLALDQVARTDPTMALRLRLARDFGLTRLEALSVDPANGLRPWGLVVGKNPFISQSRLSAPRAIPAISAEALATAREAASFFARQGTDLALVEGDLRRRSQRQRRVFQQHQIDESMFFAVANSTRLESLRLGRKWAFRSKGPLRQALAA